jgi:photosystem II stability/assembly factor-like uncharacterized protein
MSQRSSRIRALGPVAVLATLGVLTATLQGVAMAIPVDVNPNVSDNSNANASTGGRVNHLASVPGDNQTFYLASEYGGVFKTTDGGVNWNHLDAHLPVVAWDVDVDPGNTNRVVASSWYDGRVEPNSGIEVSSNAGATWTHPATSWPDPDLEGTAQDNTPAGWACANGRREPSAYGISIQGSTVAVGTNCGLALSTDSGATWRFVDPTPGDAAARIWDVLVQPGGLIDICGEVDDHMRSTDGGQTWVAGGVVPSGRCSVAASPDESDVLFIYASNNNLYESDDGGGSWNNLGNQGPQGRIPFVATNQRSNDGSTNKFDVWAADTQLYRIDCTTPADTTDTTTRRCPASASWTNAQNGAHWDGGDLMFDSQAANDACPVIYSSDGGVHRNTVAGSPGCQAPTWTRSNVGYHGLWLWTMDGNSVAGDSAEALMMGAQDNGTFSSVDAGSASPTWTNPNCCDTFDVLVSDGITMGTTCCYNSGRFNRLELGGNNYAGNAEIGNYPSTASIPSFNWGRRLNNYGNDADNVALLMTDNIWLTDDIQATPIVWSALPAVPAGTPCGVQTSMDGTTPVFYAQIGQCTGRGLDRVFRYDGTAGGGTWNRVDNTGGLPGGFGVYAVDPNNADRVYASNLGAATPAMVSTTNGGTTWATDAELDDLMTGDGTWKMQNTFGPSTNSGGAAVSFQGYPQPMMVAFDPEDSNVIVAGGADSGVFMSLDGGTNWSLVTDPFSPATSGNAHLPRPRFAYFDHEPAGTTTVFVGTQGRGVWRLSFRAPTADAGGPYSTNEGAPVTLDATGSSDPTGQALSYAWDFDADGEFDDATGAKPSFDAVGQDGSFPVAVKVTDTDGSYDVDSATVTVANVAPSLSGLASTSPDNENTVLTVTGLASDPGWLDPLTVTVDWGDGTETTATGTTENTKPDATLTFTADHTYGDNGTWSVTVCAQDDDTETCAAPFDVRIDNVDPTATINESGATTINGTPTIIGQLGSPVAFSGRSTDPGSDDLTLSWDWDDGAPVPDTSTTYLVNPPAPDPPLSPSIQPRDVTSNVSHTFGQACMYDVGFASRDDDGGTASDTAKVLITGNFKFGRPSGYWSHQYRREGSTDFTDATLTCYLEIVDYVSKVFHEVRDVSTFAKAQKLLFTQAKSVSKRDQLDRDMLTAWLNFANGAVGWAELIDTNGDGVVDTPYFQAMYTAEGVRLNPASSGADYDRQRLIMQRISDTV